MRPRDAIRFLDVSLEVKLKSAAKSICRLEKLTITNPYVDQSKAVSNASNANRQYGTGHTSTTAVWLQPHTWQISRFLSQVWESMQLHLILILKKKKKQILKTENVCKWGRDYVRYHLHAHEICFVRVKWKNIGNTYGPVQIPSRFPDPNHILRIYIHTFAGLTQSR